MLWRAAVVAAAAAVATSASTQVGTRQRLRDALSKKHGKTPSAGLTRPASGAKSSPGPLATQPFRAVDGSKAGAVANVPELLPYNPVADPAAVVVSSDGSARFTVLTPRLIRMESIKGGMVQHFEDRATLAVLNRKLPVPAFTHNEAGGVLTITTSAVTLTYQVGQAFAPGTLTVKPVAPGQPWSSWSYGDAFPGNLLGTIRGLDQQGPTPLNCTQNAGIDDNGEFNHCEWGLVSRDGWAIYNDQINFALDANYWWDQTGENRQCLAQNAGYDAVNPVRSAGFPNGVQVADAAACCAACLSDPTCVSGWVFDTSSNDNPNCWPLSATNGMIAADNRVFARVTNPSSNTDVADLYGFFHGHDYKGAIADYTLIGGKTAMVPRYASGVWNSRWFDYSSQDNLKLVDDYESRRIPLDVFVIDMDWHSKDNWSGFTFDSHLYPSPEDAMAYLKARGMGITVNIHDASGVNYWEALFPQLVQALGLPGNSTVVPFNLVNASVTYAVEDIVLGDLVYNKSVDFMWIDWQQGGDAGGMTGGKQNPTFWLNHLRCTDRHRVGDNKRAMVLARWGGLGMHRYQVGFSGDVLGLSWTNLAYQPYFSATSQNVAHPFWSHDIEGPANDPEMYTRWIQVGAFAGVMRSHDRGMSGGGCANSNPFSCSIVEPWNVPNVNFEANRIALQLREELVPYIYNTHRSAFDTGLGLINPMYYYYPEQDAAYAMDGTQGQLSQYMFGPDILFAPVITAAQPYTFGPGLASKVTWLPPASAWYDTTTGRLINVGAGVGLMYNSSYMLQQIPLFYRAGAVIPYLPLRSLPVIGLAARQYTYLGFKIAPGAASGSGVVYEDDGVTTAYLTDNAFAWTTASYTATGSGMTITISTNGSFPEQPAARAYQLRLLNVGTLASVTVNGVAVPYNRWGSLATIGQAPAAHAWYWEYAVNQGGMGPVIDIAPQPVATTLTIQVAYATPSVPASVVSGVYGVVQAAVWAKTNTDLDRSTPGSETRYPPPPAYGSILSSVGEALTHQAGTNATAFAATLNNVPSLLGLAIADAGTNGSPRAPFSVSLLKLAQGYLGGAEAQPAAAAHAGKHHKAAPKAGRHA